MRKPRRRYTPSFTLNIAKSELLLATSYRDTPPTLTEFDTVAPAIIIAADHRMHLHHCHRSSSNAVLSRKLAISSWKEVDGQSV